MMTLALALAGCTSPDNAEDGDGTDGTADGGDGADEPPTGDDGANVGEDTAAVSPVTFTATEYAFDGPSTVAAGVTTFNLDNVGGELHHGQLIALEDGYSFADDVNATRQSSAGAVPPEWAAAVGGPNAASPQESTNATLEFTPGVYVLVCFIPDADGVPHVANGMITSFNVTNEAQSDEETPVEDVVLTMVDFAYENFTVSEGRVTFKAVNEGEQDHEATLFKLNGNATASDFLQWFAAPQGSPPGKGYGGVVGIAPGGDNWFAVDLTPGNYAFVCFLPDPESGEEHFQLGMVKEFTVNGTASA